MALVLKPSICEECNCKQLVFKELTGAYDAVDNPTGWGLPNLEISDIDPDTPSLVVTKPDGSIVTIDLSGSFPTTDTNFEFIITNEMLGYTSTETLPDGLWVFEYTLGDVDGVTVYRQHIYKLFYCNAECCITKLFNEIPVSNCECTCKCDCDTSKTDNALYAWTMLKALQYAAKSGNISRFQNLLVIVNNLCTGDCGCN